MIKFTWDIHYSCNYRCPYCWYYKRWADASKQNVYLKPREWRSHWQRIYDNYGEAKIEIVGGEPFVYPDFIELVKELSQIHLIKVTTNLSGNIELFSKQVTPGRVSLDLNYHALFIGLDTVFKKAHILNNAGFDCGVCYLAYPPQMKQIPYLSRRFKEEGVRFALAAFWGEYNGVQYPRGYTEEEKELMRPFIGDIDRATYHMEGKSPKGRPCNAGHKYAVIHANGDVVRCGPLFDRIIGNILKDGFSLLEGPLPCEADACPCNEYDNIC